MEIKNELRKWSGFILSGVVGALVTAMILVPLINNAIRTGSLQPIAVEEESATIDAVNKILPSTVAIISSQNVRSVFGGVFEQRGGGTGFVISADGLIATNRHVVDSESASYSVVTSDGKSYDAEVVARDALADLAVIKIDAIGLQVAELGDSENIVLGQKVIAVGNALGEYQNSVTTGVVSGIGRVITAGDGSGSSERLEGVIQTDAAINPGNSGGPLLNLSGQVIGINTAIDQQGQSVGFAIPINSVKSALNSVIADGEIVRPRLGVRYLQITKEFAELNKLDITEGALVARGDTASEVAVIPGGPADIAGIEEGDILVSIDDEKITEKKGIPSILQNYKPGDVIDIVLLRNGKEQTVKVTLGKL
ncbi:MAG: trypsin-like peptidase domain-containing protein [Patescibacteria group bacterium]